MLTDKIPTRLRKGVRGKKSEYYNIRTNKWYSITEMIFSTIEELPKCTVQRPTLINRICKVNSGKSKKTLDQCIGDAVGKQWANRSTYKTHNSTKLTPTNITWDELNKIMSRGMK